VAAGGFGFDIVLEPEVKEKVYLAPGKSWFVRLEMIKYSILVPRLISSPAHCDTQSLGFKRIMRIMFPEWWPVKTQAMALERELKFSFCSARQEIQVIIYEKRIIILMKP
jgi:hypothetical protein